MQLFWGYVCSSGASSCVPRHSGLLLASDISQLWLGVFRYLAFVRREFFIWWVWVFFVPFFFRGCVGGAQESTICHGISTITTAKTVQTAWCQPVAPSRKQPLPCRDCRVLLLFKSAQDQVVLLCSIYASLDKEKAWGKTEG